MIAYKFDLVTMKPVPTMRQKVDRLEKSMQGMKPAEECPVRHYFAPGLYAREVTIPAGVLAVGAIHKTDNLIVVSKGRLRIVTDEATRVVEAGETIHCKAGTKNSVLALEESKWTNFFPNPTNENDPDKLVEMFTHSKASELLGGKDNPQAIAYAALMKLED